MTAAAAFESGGVAAAAPPRAQRDPAWLDRLVAAVPAICASVLSKLSIPPFGAAGLSLSIPLLGLTSALGLALGRLVVDAGRLCAYLALLALLWGMQALHSDVASLPSLLMFTLLHFPYVLQLREPPPYERVLAGFMALVLAIALLGIAQYIVQFFTGPMLAFPIENYFPEALKVSRFNMQGYLEYGSQVYRTNGVFMLEPSFFSQFLAVGIVIEAVTLRRAWMMAVLLAGIGVSFSGTGLMLLAVCLPLVAAMQRRWGLLLAGVALLLAGLLLALLADNPYLNVFFKRAGEFNQTGSSGFARFVGGFYLFEQFLWPDPFNALFGMGAGALQAVEYKARWAYGGNAVFKMVFEFGLLGGIAYFAFLWYCISRSIAPVMVRLAVALCYLLAAIYIPFAHCLALGLLIWPAARGGRAS